MPTVTFLPSGQSVEVEINTSVYCAAEAAKLPIASSCSGNFICGKCNVQVLQGEENLTPRGQPEEMLLLREKHPPTDRISCRAFVQGPCTITTRYW